MSYSELTSNEKLDTILNLLYDIKNKELNHEQIFAAIGAIEKVDKFDAILVIDHLETVDKYITHTREGEELFYRILFDGKKFKEDGGYSGEYARQVDLAVRLDKLESDQKENQTNMVRLTILIAFGTIIQAIYYLFEFLKQAF